MHRPELTGLVFSISTGALGTVSMAEYFLRFYRLWKHNSDCRVIGARRYYVRFPRTMSHSDRRSSISSTGTSHSPG
jgi:hypothetical protein